MSRPRRQATGISCILSLVLLNAVKHLSARCFAALNMTMIRTVNNAASTFGYAADGSFCIIPKVLASVSWQ
jgi:hypothetical protein